MKTGGETNAGLGWFLANNKNMNPVVPARARKPPDHPSKAQAECCF